MLILKEETPNRVIRKYFLKVLMFLFMKYGSESFVYQGKYSYAQPFCRERFLL